MAPEPPPARWDGASVLLLLGFVAAQAYYGWIAASQHLALCTWPHDVGLMDYCFYSTLHGRFMYSPVIGQTHFGVHFTPTLLLLVPFYAVFDSPLTLLLFQSAFLVAAAVPLYLIVRELTADRLLAALTASIYLTNYFTASIHLAAHYEAIFPFLTLCTIHAALTGSERRYWTFLVLALGVKTDAPLYLFFLGAYLAPEPRTRRMGIGTMLLAGAWFAVGMGVVKLLATSTGPAYFRNWSGGAGAGLLATAWGGVASLFTARVMLLLATVGFGCLLDPRSAWLILPPLLVLTTSSKPDLRALLFYRTAMVLPFLFFSCANGLRRLVGWCGPGSILPVMAAALVAVAGATIWVSWPTLTKGMLMRPFPITEEHELARKLCREIPPEASVAAHWELYCQVPHRMNMYTLKDEARADYVVLDILPSSNWGPPEENVKLSELYADLGDHAQLVASVGQKFFLFRRLR